MKALQILEPGRAELVELDRPSPGAGELLVRVQAITSCPHWDMAFMAGADLLQRPGYPKYPILPGREGHEMCGVVEEIGEGVEDLAPGQRVATWLSTREGRWGCYAEYAAVPASDVLPVPDDLPDEAIASLELAMCVSVCFLDMPDITGLRFSVGGLGGAGLVAVQLARAAGAGRIIGFDPLEGRRDLALELGADCCLDPVSEEARAFLRQARGACVDASIDCSGVSDSVQFQMDVAGKWVSLFGVEHGAYEYTIRHRHLTLYGAGHHRREAAEYAMERILDGRLKLSPLVSRELPLSRFAEGTELLRRKEAIKILYRPSE